LFFQQKIANGWRKKSLVADNLKESLRNLGIVLAFAGFVWATGWINQTMGIPHGMDSYRRAHS
jgi:hypothetical protein